METPPFPRRFKPVKVTVFQLSLGVSLLFHAALFGLLAISGMIWHGPAIQQQESAITLTLIAAPEDFAPPQTTIQTVTSVPSVPTMPVETRHIETPTPVEPVKSVAVANTPQPPQQTIQPASPIRVTVASIPPKVPPHSDIHGDGSSPTPGQDSTTHEAQPGIQATPNYLKNPEPPYPLLARRHHQEGLVLLAVRVTSQGRAATVALKQTSGFPLLDEAAVRAVQNWEFEPARIGSMAVESQIEVPVRFRLQ